MVGFAIAAVLFIDRMAGAITIEGRPPLVPEGQADDANGDRRPYDPTLAPAPEIIIYRIAGAFFFGAASTVGAVLDGIGGGHKAFILDLSAVPFLDPTAANTIAGLDQREARYGVQLLSTGVTPGIRYTLLTHGLRAPHVRFKRIMEETVRAARVAMAGAAGPAQSPKASTP